MRRRWKVILPVIGLMLFGGVTYQSLEGRRQEKVHGQYFWWASIRLDTHQVDRSAATAPSCEEADENCAGWEPRAIEDPGWLTKALIVSAFPAFLIGVPVVRSLGHFGVNEVPTFMIVMPPLIAAWFYALAWLDERWIRKRSQTSSNTKSERQTTSD